MALKSLLKVVVSLVLLMPWACGDSSGTEADLLGVGAQCSESAECGESQACLLQFKGGYCGLTGCESDEDCPNAAACVAHDDGNNYCFRICVDKEECNANRDSDNEANCSSNIVFAEAAANKNTKACVPPSG